MGILVVVTYERSDVDGIFVAAAKADNCVVIIKVVMERNWYRCQRFGYFTLWKVFLIFRETRRPHLIWQVRQEALRSAGKLVVTDVVARTWVSASLAPSKRVTKAGVVNKMLASHLNGRNGQTHSSNQKKYGSMHCVILILIAGYAYVALRQLRKTWIAKGLGLRAWASSLGFICTNQQWLVQPQPQWIA